MLSKKLTYLETAYMTYSEDDVISINENSNFIEERFQMPYDIFDSFSVQIANGQRDSNALWKAYLLTDDGTIIAQKEFGFFDATDNAFYEVDFGKRLKVDKGEFYRIRIESLGVEDGNKIGFYIGYDTNTHSQNASLYFNGNLVSGNLRLIINGGDQDYFWFAVYAFIVCVIAFVCFRGVKLREKGIAWYEDKLICSILVGLLVFFVYLPFASTNVTEVFIDENDNIRGGMIIASGKVLYRDYVVQHPPVGYYLCAIFALLGAGSGEQMRILFYIAIAIGWGLLYARYNEVFGKRIMTAMPIGIILCTRVLMGSESSMVLSDVIQEMALVLLMLEFIYYSRERKLNWSRCIIVSFAIWAAFGCAFVSIYSIFLVFIGFLVVEIAEWRKRTQITLKSIVQRYFPLATSILVPAIAAMVYFKINHALYECFEQMYLFNREVYTQYQSVGRNLFEPFLSGLSSMLSNYISSILAIGGNGEVSIYHVAMIIVVTGFVVCVVKRIVENKKEILNCLLLTLIIAAGATRGVETFHGLAFWGMLIAWLFIFPIRERNAFKIQGRVQVLLCAVIVCILVNPYISALTTNMAADQKPVSYNDTLIVDRTEEGEGIFINAYNNDSIYLLEKNRFPVNRAVYCLPWYMDWYEDWDIEDLKEYMPDIVVWNPDQECWERTNYAERLEDLIRSEYTQIGEGSVIWQRNDVQ